MTKQSKAEKAEDKIIERIYGQHCAGCQISVLRIGELFKMARVALRAGETHDQVGARMLAFVTGEPS